ncbi:hypothetical protein SHIRM173S_03054 [Streptomyces hirsutus]
MALRTGAAHAPQATTFHSLCLTALIRAHQDSDLFVEPLRLLSGPEQDVTVRELLAGQVDLERLGLAHVRWPDELRACLTTRGFADEVRAVLARSRELGLAPTPWTPSPAASDAPTGVRRPPSSPSTSTSSTCRASATTPNWSTAAGLVRAHPEQQVPLRSRDQPVVAAPGSAARPSSPTPAPCSGSSAGR